jgi:hypothetical protein
LGFDGVTGEGGGVGLVVEAAGEESHGGWGADQCCGAFISN